MKSESSVTFVAASPDDIKTRGAGMTIHAGIASSPFGNCLIGDSLQGICHLSFLDGTSPEKAILEIRAAWPLASITRNDPHAEEIGNRLFCHMPLSSSRWSLFVRGTPFQLQIWRTLMRVPHGKSISYNQLAAAAGTPRAARATGNALARNTIAFLIPCHRVVRESGDTGHYRWGSDRKRAILAWENGRSG